MELYINGKEAYLSERLEPNFTYKFLDSLNPSAVKTGYSKTVTLPDCAQNNTILSPLRDRYDWAIYENGRILESGYCTLDDETEEGFRREYHLTLYGGLGSFFYSLQSGSDRPKNLCDINLGFGESLEADNAFTQSIDCSFVYQGWNSTGSVSDILKLVPCTWKVNGFDYTKTIIDNTGGIFPTSTAEGQAYVSGGTNYLLVTADENTPYAKQDFRIEYMPIAIRYKNIIEGCCDPEVNGGYEVHLDPDFFNEDNPYWTDMYLMNTVPAAESSGESSEISEVYSNFTLEWMNMFQEEQTKYYHPSGSTDYWHYSGSGWLEATEIIAGNQFEVSVTPTFTITPPSSTAGYKLRIKNGNNLYSMVTVENDQGQTVAGHVAWTPSDEVILSKDQNSGAFKTQKITLTIPDSWTKMRFKLFNFWTTTPEFQIYVYGESLSWRKYTNLIIGVDTDTAPAKLTTQFFNPDETVLGGITFDKKTYLSNTKTPLDYLLAYTKMFNLRFYVHPGLKKVDILTFPNYINAKGVVDITDRVDYGKPYVTTRKLLDEGILNFNLDPEKNVTVQKYYDEEGQNILDRRVVVGSDPRVKDYLGSLGIRVGSRSRQESAFAIRNGSFSYYYLGFNQQSPYQLGYMSGSTVISQDYSLNYLNEPSRYDVLEVQDPSNVVVMFAGTRSVPFEGCPAIISNNSKAMMRYAGKPCFLGGVPGWLHEGEERPIFGSRCKATYNLPVFSLTPNYPDSAYGISFSNENYDSIIVSSNLFDLYFKDFVESLYIRPRKVTCWVRLQNPELRCLYYFDNRYWVVSEIRNYNFQEGNEETQCEFLEYQPLYA